MNGGWGAPPRAARIRARLGGIALLARGRANGLGAFPGTRRDAALSFVPLLSLPLAGFLVGGDTDWRGRLVNLLAGICALLAPPVLSQAVAARLGRSELWPRYVSAANWCHWAMPVLALAPCLAVAVGALAVGARPETAIRAVLAALIGYGLWLHWFVARHALSLEASSAALLVAASGLGGLAAVLAPRLLAPLLGLGLDRLLGAHG